MKFNNDNKAANNQRRFRSIFIKCSIKLL